MPSDIKVAVGNWGCNTSAGSQELTIADLGWTPKAAIFICSGAATAGTRRGSSSLSIGMIGDDGAGGWNSGVITFASRDAVGTSDTRRHYYTPASNPYCAGFHFYGSTGFRWWRANGEGDGSGSNNGPIANGWRVTWSNEIPDGNAFRITAIFFGGDDLQNYCGQHTHSGTGVEDITAPGFEGSLLFNIWDWQTSVNNEATGINQGFGAASWDGATLSQNSLQKDTGHNNANGVQRARLSNDQIGGRALNTQLAVSDFDANGFSFQLDIARDGSVSTYLLLDTGDRSVWVDSIDAPTSAGSDWASTAPGFEPQFVMLGQSLADTENVSIPSGIGSEGYGLGVSDGTREFCHANSSRDGNTTMNEDALFENKIAWLYDGADNEVFDMDNLSLDANGFSVASADISTVDATARKWFGVSIEVSAGNPWYAYAQQ